MQGIVQGSARPRKPVMAQMVQDRPGQDTGQAQAMAQGGANDWTLNDRT